MAGEGIIGGDRRGGIGAARDLRAAHPRRSWIALIRETGRYCSDRVYCWTFTTVCVLFLLIGWFVGHYWQSMLPQAPRVHDVKQVAGGWEIRVVAEAPTNGNACTRILQHVIVQGKRVAGTERYEPGAHFLTLDSTLNGPGLAPYAISWVKPLMIPRTTPAGHWDYWIRSFQHCPPLGLISRSSSVGPFPIVVPDEKGASVRTQIP